MSRGRRPSQQKIDEYYTKNLDLKGNKTLAEEPEDVKLGIKLLAIEPKKARIFGSYNYRSQLYPSDVDLIEEFKGKCNPRTFKKLAGELQRIVKNIIATKGIYLGDVKIGADPIFIDLLDFVGEIKFEKKRNKIIPKIKEFDNESSKQVINIMYNSKYINKKEYDELYKLLKKSQTIESYIKLEEAIKELFVLRWSGKEILQGYKILKGNRIYNLEQAVTDGHVVKIDMWIPINGKYIEMTNYFSIVCTDSKGKEIYITDTMPDTTLEQLKIDILERSGLIGEDDYSPFKLAKRLWSLSRLQKDKDTIKLLNPLLRSSVAIMYQARSEIDTLKLMLERIPKPPLKHMYKQLDALKSKLANVYEFQFDRDKVIKSLDKVSSGKLKKPEAIKILDSLDTYLKKIVNEQAEKYLKYVRLLPLPKKFIKSF